MVTGAKVKNLESKKVIPFQIRFAIILISLVRLPAFCQSTVLPKAFEIRFSVSPIDSFSTHQNCTSLPCVSEVIKNELSHWQNTGFPFAQAQVDTIQYSQVCRLWVRILPGPAIVNGELIIHGDSSVSSGIIRNWIRFKKNSPFSLLRFSQIPFLTSHIPFASEIKGPDLEWFGNQAVVHLYLQRRRNNAFSGILGVLPQPGNSGTIITGNIDASLSNLFRQGIGCNFKWSRFAPTSQTALLQVIAPALNSSGLGIEGNFDLFRQDSLINKLKADVQWLSMGANLWQIRFGLFTSFSSGKLENVDSGLQSVSTRALVFGLKFKPDPDNQINIRQKFLSIQALPSLKNIRRNNATFSEPQIDFQATGNFPLYSWKNRFCLQSSFNSAFLFSDLITLPDQYRIGGSNSFRGFNENYFFTSQHFMSEIAPQILLDKSFLMGAFFGVMWYNSQRAGFKWSSLSSAFNFGIASQFEIGSNLVKISVANGFSEELPFDFQTTKIHFGYVARF